MGEINFERRQYDTQLESTIVANDILNDILDTAMDMAESKALESKKMNIIDEMQEENGVEIKDIIDGLSKINVGGADEKVSLEVEVKRLLSEIMSPTPFEILRNNGVGDQSIERPERQPPPECTRPSKIVEKKSRITDLVMNSKKALNNLLSDEEKKKLNDWEESCEKVIKVTELQPPQMEVAPENIPLPPDEEDDLLSPPNEEALVAVDLGAQKAGEGDEYVQEEKKLDVKEAPKKKKWYSKFFGFRLHRNKQSN